MIYRIVHKTTYRYKSTVSFGDHVACLTPRNLPHHRCIRHELRITPHAVCSARVDYFGNQLSFFTVQEPHTRLIVEARSEVVLDCGKISSPPESPPWEEVARCLPHDRSLDS